MRGLILGLALVLLGLGFSSPVAASSQMPEQLIDRLTRIDCHGPGLYNYWPYDDFWAVLGDAWHAGAPPPGSGPPDCIPDAMRELVRLGPKALPALVKHISDARPTRIKVGSKLDPKVMYVGDQLFAGEYDPRVRAYREPCKDEACTARSFDDPYTVKVGDVCFVLIGQIVNRELVAARYQMTGYLIVNSPVETPWLATKVRADWTGMSAGGLRASLLADLRSLTAPSVPGYKRPSRDKETDEERESEDFLLDRLRAGALRRLRFYYPDTYAALSGPDLDRRRAFEQQERDERREREEMAQ